MRKKLQKYFQKISDIAELVVAAATFLGILVAMWMMAGEFMEFVGSGEITALNLYLKEIFTVVIAIEFLKMLCKPSADNVIEVLTFVVARHMIIHETEPMDDLLSVVAIALLLVLQSFMKKQRRHMGKDEGKIYEGGQEK